MLVVSYHGGPDQGSQRQVLLDRGFSEAQVNATLKGSEPKAVSGLGYTITNTKNLRHPRFFFLVSLWQKYKQGVLPYNGSLVDQPAKIIEIFDVLTELEWEQQERERKKHEKEQRKHVRR